NDELVLQWQEPAGQFKPGDWKKAPSRKVLDQLLVFEIWTRMDEESQWARADVEGKAPSHVKLIIKANGKFWPELIMTVQR
ncbi:MAG: general secretion pathway protein GspJ, partial [Halieaceae bacterium]|nr:general secretion pathway protein GspJ [Halieaceae bacterium]